MRHVLSLSRESTKERPGWHKACHPGSPVPLRQYERLFCLAALVAEDSLNFRLRGRNPLQNRRSGSFVCCATAAWGWWERGGVASGLLCGLILAVEGFSCCFHQDVEGLALRGHAGFVEVGRAADIAHQAVGVYLSEGGGAGLLGARQESGVQPARHVIELIVDVSDALYNIGVEMVDHLLAW